MKRFLPITFCLLTFLSCSEKANKLAHPSFNYLNFVKVTTSMDTLNSGEQVAISFSLIDTSYFRKHHAYPTIRYAGEVMELKYPVCSFHNEDVVAISSDSIIERKYEVQLMLENEANQDTTIRIPFHYFVTNLEESKRTVGKLINSEKAGVWTFYYDATKKNIREVSHWVHNERNGRTERYFPSGKLSQLEYYQNGLPHGKWLTYNSAGNLSSVDIFDQGKLVKTDAKDRY